MSTHRGLSLSATRCAGDFVLSAVFGKVPGSGNGMSGEDGGSGGDCRGGCEDDWVWTAKGITAEIIHPRATNQSVAPVRGIRTCAPRVYYSIGFSPKSV